MAASSGIVHPPRAHRSRVLPLAFIVLVCATLGLFLVPAFIIQPFRFQSARGLVLAMALREFAPFWSLMSLGASLLLAWWLWGRASRWTRSALVAGLCLGCAAAVMSRIDYFEWMFHPVPVPGFESADKAKLDSAEMVMAIHFGDEARAYPIRAMAYHHVVNDVVAGVPIAVTY
jgi:hypothetical protein